MNTETITQRSQTVPLATGNATVRRMYWKPSIAFLSLLAKHFSGIKDIVLAGQKPADGDSMLAAPKVDLVALLLPKLVDLITSVDELASHLIEHSTDLDAEARAKLDLGDALEVIRVALLLNTGEDLKKSCAGIAQQIAGLMSISANSTAKSTTL